MESAPRTTITVLGWQWVGEWLPLDDRAVDLLGCGSAPRIHYPKSLRCSQQPCTRAAELPPEELTVPSGEEHCSTHAHWPASVYQGLKKVWLRAVSSFRINVYPLGLTST